ncbi:hypothetical protein GCM10009734_73010 [Nonomuraea bangladeshensis]
MHAVDVVAHLAGQAEPPGERVHEGPEADAPQDALDVHLDALEPHLIGSGHIAKCAPRRRAGACLSRRVAPGVGRRAAGTGKRKREGPEALPLVVVPASGAVALSGRGHRYWPVLATVSIERPASLPCLPETSVRM